MKIKKSEFKEIIKEEIDLIHLEQLMLAEQQRIDSLHEEMRLEILSEGWKEELPHIGLDVLGLIPGVGEAADLTNAALYAKKGEHLMAALSVISMLPVVGDALGKGGKISMYLSKFGAKGGAKAGTALSKLFAQHMPKITKTLGSLKSNKLVGPYVDDMAVAITKYADDLGSKAADQVLPQLQKAVGVAPVPKVSKNQYIALAQKVKTKSDVRQSRQDIADKISGQDQQQSVVEQNKEKEQPPKITPDMINNLLKGVEQFSEDPAVIDAMGKGGLARALQIIKSKIMAGEQPSAGEEQGLAGVMEVSSEKQRRWACAQKDKPASERADGLSAAEAEEMCKSKIEEDG